MSDMKKAVILLAFGGAESLNDVEPFLQNIMTSRKPSPKMIEEIRERYRLIGGKSPLCDITRGQTSALQDLLDTSGKGDYLVYTGMRFSRPYIKDTIREIHERGIHDITAIIMAPQKSGYTEGAYQRDIHSALSGLDPAPHIRLISEWYDNVNYLKAVSEKIRRSLSSFSNNEKTVVIFSGHSLPIKFMGSDDPYEKQISDTIKGILNITGPLNWKLGYQSKGMIPGEWLGPDVDSILESLPGEGYKNVLLVPVGFVADHVETLYDIDIVFRKKAETLGLHFERSASLNDSPLFIKALKEIVIDSSF